MLTCTLKVVYNVLRINHPLAQVHYKKLTLLLQHSIFLISYTTEADKVGCHSLTDVLCLGRQSR